MRIASYIRVSTSKQTTDNQKPEIQAYTEQFTDAKITWYEDIDSAFHGNQHYLANLKHDIRSGKKQYDMLVIWAFDRLTRRGGMDLLTEYKFFMDHGIRVVSIKERWLDIPKEFVPVLITLAGYLAEIESKRRSERVKAGNARTLKDGVTRTGRKIKQLGRPKGSRDNPNRPRKKTGYLLRYANKVSPNSTLEPVSVD